MIAVLQGKPGRTYCFLLEDFGCSFLKKLTKIVRAAGQLMKAEIFLGQGWCWSAEPHSPHADLHGLPGHPGKMFSCVSLLGRQAQEDHLDLKATGKFPPSLFTSSPSILFLQRRCHHIQKSRATRAVSAAETQIPSSWGSSSLWRALQEGAGVSTSRRPAGGPWLIYQSHPSGPFSYILPASPPKAA